MSRLLLAAVALACVPAAPTAAPAPLARRNDRSWVLESLDRNARLAKGFVFLSRVDLDVRHGRQAVGLGGEIAFDGAGRFRLRGTVLGSAYLDHGHGEGKTWCKGRFEAIEEPLPSDCVPILFGVAEYGRAGRYAVAERNGRLELARKIEWRGERLRRVIVVGMADGQARVVGLRLEDADGKAVLTASVEKTVREPRTGAEVPTRIRVQWPRLDAKLTIALEDVQARPITREDENNFQPPE